MVKRSLTAAAKFGAVLALAILGSNSSGRAEQLAYYSFNADPSSKVSFPDSLASFVRVNELIGIAGVTKDPVTGNGRVLLGRLADYGDVGFSGRGILRLSSFANRSLKLSAISFNAQVNGTKADKFSVLVNDQVVHQVADLTGSTNFNIDLTSYMLAGKCFVIELRGERYQDVTDSMSIDDLTIEGEKVEEDGDAGPKQCWQRTLDLTNTLAFYGFDYGSSRPTYANALVSPSNVVDLFGQFDSSGGQIIVEETGEADNGYAILPPGPPNAYVFALQSPPKSRLFIDKVRFRAAGQGSHTHLPRNMEVFLDGASISGPVQINGVMKTYEFPVNQALVGSGRELMISIWGAANQNSAYIDDVEILGRVEMLGPGFSVPR